MLPEDVAVAVRAGVALLLLIAVVYFMIRKILNDEFRQSLFDIRRELFELVASGKISPTMPAYVDLRDSLNVCLSAAEHFSFVGLVVTAIWNRKNAREVADRLNAQLCAIPDTETRERILQLRRRTGTTVLRYLAIKSPLAWSLICLFAVVVALSAVTGGLSAAKRLVHRSVLHGRLRVEAAAVLAAT